MKDTLREAREKLAAIEHERWSDWQKWCHQVLRDQLPTDMLNVLEPTLRRWDRQAATPYSALPDKEKASDMEQVDRYWPIILSLIEEEKNKYQPLDTEVMRSKFFAECRANTEFQRELAKKSKGER